MLDRPNNVYQYYSNRQAQRLPKLRDQLNEINDRQT